MSGDIQTRLIGGNTYPHRAELKMMGGTWDARARGWLIPVSLFDAAVKLVATTPHRYARQAARARRYTLDDARDYAEAGTGGRRYPAKRGRCEDAPCCGCCP